MTNLDAIRIVGWRGKKEVDPRSDQATSWGVSWMPFLSAHVRFESYEAAAQVRTALRTSYQQGQRDLTEQFYRVFPPPELQSQPQPRSKHSHE